MEMIKKNILHMIKIFLCQVIVSGLLLIILSYLFLKMRWEDNILYIGIGIIYGVTNLLGGLLMGKASERKRYLKGMMAGAAYFAVLVTISVIISVITSKNPLSDGIPVMITLAICVFSGMFGGMIS